MTSRKATVPATDLAALNVVRGIQRTVLDSFDTSAIARAGRLGDLARAAGITSATSSHLETIAKASDLSHVMKFGVTEHPAFAKAMGIDKAHHGTLAALATSKALQATVASSGVTSKLRMMDIVGESTLAKVARLSNPPWMQDLEVVEAATSRLKFLDSLAPAIEQQQRVQQIVDDLMRSVRVDPEGTATTEATAAPLPIAKEVAAHAGISLEEFLKRTKDAYNLIFPILLAALMVTEASVAAVFRSVTWSLALAMLWAATTTPEEPSE